MSFSTYRSRLSLPRPPIHVSTERIVHRPITIHESFPIRETRGHSVESLNRGVLSEKVPISFTPQGLTFHSMPSKVLDKEDKVSLYSELERLSMINLELKRQNESLLAEAESNKHVISRVPQMEAQISSLQNDLHRSETVGQTLRNHEIIKENLHLSRLEPAYNELLEHNKALIREIDTLDSKLQHLLREKDLMIHDSASVNVLHPRLVDATQRIEHMATDLHDKDVEIEHFRQRVGELNSRITVLTLEAEQYRNRVLEVKAQMENEKEIDRAELREKYTVELMIKDEQLAQLRKQVEDLEDRIVLAATELEHLRQRNLAKSAEIDTLTIKVRRLEEEKNQIKVQSEVEAQLQVERELAQQKVHYDTIILQLSNQVGDLERTKVLVKQRETDIEVMKSQAANNEKAWEVRLQATVEHEVKSLSNKHDVEKTVLESELMANKDRLNSLEFQNTFLHQEMAKLNEQQNEKQSEIFELQRNLTTQEVNHKLALDELRSHMEVEKKNSLEELRKNLERIHQDRVDELRAQQVELESRTVKLLDENTHLTVLADSQKKDIESSILKSKILEEAHYKQIQDVERKAEVQQQMAVERELNSAALRYNEEMGELENAITHMNFDLENFKSQCQTQELELEHLREMLKERELELQQDKRKYIELELQRTRDISEVKEQFEAYKRANVDAGTLQVRFEAERSLLNSQIGQHREKVDELEKRLLLFIGENEKMRELYNDKTNELEIMKAKYRDLEDRWYNVKGDLENEIEHLRRSNLDNKETSIRFNSEKSQYENQIKQLKTINENGKQELEKLYELMNQRKKDHDYYVKQNEELKREVDRLTRSARNIDNESSFAKERSDGLERTVLELEREKDIYRDQNERLNIQLRQSQADLEAKIRELEISKRKYDESLKSLSTQLDKDLMHKLIGNTSINTSPVKKDYLGGTGF